MLNKSKIVPTIPAWDLERAKKFYTDVLGFGPGDEDPAGVKYTSGSGEFLLFTTAAAKPAEHTLVSWEVSDIEAAVKELRGKGVKFEDIDVPGLKTVDGIGTMGKFRAAWFKDSEGNTLAVGEPT
jgi:catechol 2,3-dioxygenase-like lactoylglutathione lyase family enzyme